MSIIAAVLLLTYCPTKGKQTFSDSPTGKDLLVQLLKVGTKGRVDTGILEFVYDELGRLIRNKHPKSDELVTFLYEYLATNFKDNFVIPGDGDHNQTILGIEMVRYC